MRTKELLTSLRKAKRNLAKFKKELPHTDDSFITVECISNDTIKVLTDAIIEIPLFLKMAREEKKK